MSAAVRRSYCCSRSSSNSVSGSDARARFLPTVGSAFVVVPICPILLVKCLVYSFLDAANRRGGRNKCPLGFLLYQLEQPDPVIDPGFHCNYSLLQSPIE